MAASTELDPESRKYWRQCTGMGVAILTIFVLGPAALGAYLAKRSAEAAGWERTQGALVSAEEYDGPAGFRSGLAVEYTYLVDGAEHAGRRYSVFGNSFDSEAEFRAKHVNAQGQIWVYYNPDDPAEAVLATGFASGVDPLFWSWGCVWAVLLPLGGWFLLRGVWSLGRGTPMPARARRYRH